MGKKIDLKSERFGNTSIFLSFEITVRQINFQFGQEVCITITLFSYWHNVESTLLCSLRGQLRPLYSLEIYWKFKLNEIQSKQHLSRIGTRVTTARSINVCCPFEPSFAFNRARVNFPSFFYLFPRKIEINPTLSRTLIFTPVSDDVQISRQTNKYTRI